MMMQSFPLQDFFCFAKVTKSAKKSFIQKYENYVKNRPLDVEIFQRINEKFDLLVAPEVKSRDHQSQWDQFSGLHRRLNLI